MIQSTDTESQFKTHLADAKQILERCMLESKLYSSLRLAVFLIGIFFCVFAAFYGYSVWVNTVVITSLVCSFIGLVAKHAKVQKRMAIEQAVVEFWERSLAKLDERWHSFSETGLSYTFQNHPYAHDLDLFGPGSLFQRLNMAKRNEGKAKLASWLSSARDVQESHIPRIEMIQNSVKELKNLRFLRASLFAHGGILSPREKKKPEANKPSLPDVSQSFKFFAKWPLRICSAFQVFILGSVFFSSMSSSALVASWFAGTLFSWLYTTNLRNIFYTADGGFDIGDYSSFFDLLKRQTFVSKRLTELHVLLVGEGEKSKENSEAETFGAHRAFRHFARIMSFRDALHNDVFRLFLSPLVCYNFHVAYLLFTWQKKYGHAIPKWNDGLSELEVLSSLASFADENPHFVWPTWVVSTTGDEKTKMLDYDKDLSPRPVERKIPVFEAEELAHPLLSSKSRRGNSICLEGDKTRIFLVTGSNMAGKSTWLRSIGINYVLAQIGAPVCAASFRCSPLRLYSSMRVNDSLQTGASRFYAEISQIKIVVDAARDLTRGPMLFLIDEIMHGTNSIERRIGAQAVIRELFNLGHIGLVSTHDLELTQFESPFFDAVKTVHFREQITDGKMTFDYKLCPGPVTTSNALELMRMVGLDIHSRVEAKV